MSTVDEMRENEAKSYRNRIPRAGCDNGTLTSSRRTGARRIHRKNTIVSPDKPRSKKCNPASRHEQQARQKRNRQAMRSNDVVLGRVSEDVPWHFQQRRRRGDGCAENNVEREKVSTTRRTYPYARGPREARDSSVSSPVTIVECGRWFVRHDTQWPRQARSRSPSSRHAEDPARTPAVAATTCGRQWRRDARVLGSLPFHAMGSSGPLPCGPMPTLV